MKNRCQLCGGKIINGKCSDCGMDYTRRREEYQLNTPRTKNPEEKSADMKAELEKRLAQKTETSGKTFAELRKQHIAAKGAMAQAKKSQKFSWIMTVLILILVFICMILGYVQDI